MAITDPTVKNIYTKFVGKKQLIVEADKEKKEAIPVIDDYQAKMDKRYDKIAKMTDEMMDVLNDIKEKTKDNPLLYV